MEFEIPVSQEILTEVARIDRFQGEWSSGQGVRPERLGRMMETSLIQSVAASSRLSGLRVSDIEVAGLLAGEGIPLTDAGQIRGYSRALRYPLPDGGALLGTGSLKSLYALVAGGEASSPQQWRTHEYHREAFDSEGKSTGRVLTTLPPRLIESKMEDLVTWFEFEMRTRDRHPVLVVGTFILGFLASSPFETANGRMARLLIGRLLERAGYSYMPFASIEQQIEDSREEYYDAMDRSQSRFWSGEARIEPWLAFFLKVLSGHRERVEAKVELERDATSLPPLQQAILSTVREHGTVDAGLLIRATGANRNTLKDNLRRMVDRGVLERNGQRRGTRYRLATESARSAVAKKERRGDSATS